MKTEESHKINLCTQVIRQHPALNSDCQCKHFKAHLVYGNTSKYSTTFKMSLVLPNHRVKVSFRFINMVKLKALVHLYNIDLNR